MKFRLFVAVLAVTITALAIAASAQPRITGDYIETRSADVYTGQCFANGEVGLVGDEAILGWRVQQGEWNGVRLDGLSVVGVVKANATLGDPYGNPYPAKSVLIVDDQEAAGNQSRIKIPQPGADWLVEITINVNK